MTTIIRELVYSKLKKELSRVGFVSMTVDQAAQFYNQDDIRILRGDVVFSQISIVERRMEDQEEQAFRTAWISHQGESVRGCDTISCYIPEFA